MHMIGVTPITQADWRGKSIIDISLQPLNLDYNIHDSAVFELVR